MHIFTMVYWKYFFSFRVAVKAILSSFGILWLLIETTSFFTSNGIDAQLRQNWYFVLILALVWTFLETKPKLKTTFKVPERDIKITIIIKDIFDLNGFTKIIGSNNKFLTTTRTKSLSSSYIKKYYNSKDEIDKQISAELKNITEEFIDENGNKIYSLGTAVSVSPNKNEKAYFVAIANKNNYGKSNANENDLFSALDKFWVYLIERGEVEDLLLPLIGTGTAMLATKREVIAVKLIESFLNASSKQVFCPNLIIPISPNDFFNFSLKPREFFEFIHYYFNNIYSEKR